MVSYPNKPKIGNKTSIGNRTNIGNNRGNTYIKNVNVGRRNNGLNRPSTLPANNRNWNHNQWGGKNSVWGNNVHIGNNVNINVNNRFYNNNNFAYRPNYWGGRPWWGANTCHGWHHGHWGYGWNSAYYHNHWYYHDNDFAEGFMWGIAVWSLGNMIYDMGYKSYQNPYPAPPVQNTYVNYTEPLSVAAAANPPGDDSQVDLAATKSDEALDRSRVAFRKGDYVAASTAVDEALGYTPDDVTIHEFRALVFFALNKYSDAAGVLNAVLASGPGWSWDTMIGFYDSSSTYDEQLRNLENYVKGSPDKADAHFLLGYHYMVCGEMEKANQEFTKASELQPADSISRQLRDLTAASIPDNGEAAKEAMPPVAPTPVPLDKLVGTWVSKSDTGGTITFTMKETGDYTWDYSDGKTDSKLNGTYGLDDQGLLVLTSNDSQMVSEVKFEDDSEMHFSLIGSPDGDPGLDFKKG
ncbi:tetratricopeptide repeat protein [Haloferula chungangensis]